MSFNRGLVGLAGGVLTILGADRYRYINLPYQCQQAITNKLSDAQISMACPAGFNNGSLVGVILLGIAVFVVVTFGRDILEAVSKQLNPDSS